MRIVRGTYEMAIGTTRTDITSFAQGGKQKLVPAATVLLLAGSAYEMVNQNGWHSVRPVTDVTLSVMVTGRPWSRQGPKSGKKLNPLAQHTVREMLGQFRKYYCINE
jgi:hypothetical protein